MPARWPGHSKVGAIIPDYRLAPEHKHPAAIDDCVAAYLGVLGEGVKASNIVIAGDSAGGALVMALLLRLQGKRHGDASGRDAALAVGGPRQQGLEPRGQGLSAIRS